MGRKKERQQAVIDHYVNRMDDEGYVAAVTGLSRLYEPLRSDSGALAEWQALSQRIADEFDQGLNTVCEDAGRIAIEARHGESREARFFSAEVIGVERFVTGDRCESKLDNEGWNGEPYATPEEAKAAALRELALAPDPEITENSEWVRYHRATIAAIETDEDGDVIDIEELDWSETNLKDEQKRAFEEAFSFAYDWNNYRLEEDTGFPPPPPTRLKW